MIKHLCYIKENNKKPTHVLVKEVVMRNEDNIESLMIKEIDPFRAIDFESEDDFSVLRFPNIPFNLQEKYLNE